ncbi:NAD(P)H-dependent flavin oxidoreductase [Actinomadura harenae]|uniref:Nitronate monooxygenase n=1 Tax=Actinomadura harenae TaxID=2483351 RepID=A0A3M2MCF4_9ACTN|nr:nitronate monooxygenase [Actinomadura harenae]RMI46583.1 nitronate monooxygenase [Actinomadura harenae]
MTLATVFTELLGVRHPIVLAPMGGSAGGALAAAVSRGGGLGMLGSGDGDAEWLAREAPIVAGQGLPWGVGFLTWRVDVQGVERALEYDPDAVMFSFGDPGPFADVVHDAGKTLIVQVTGMDEARRALDVGADVIVAQGTDAGGHGARHGRGTLPFVPAVVDLVQGAQVPVLAAGGIADGRGVAAALALGADGALIGTRFQATREALVDPDVRNAIVDAKAEDTRRSGMLDRLRRSPWPARYTARTLAHPHLDRHRGREEGDIARDRRAQRDYQRDLDQGAIPAMPVWAGEGVDLIRDVPSAEELVRTLAAETETALVRAARGPRGRMVG